MLRGNFVTEFGCRSLNSIKRSAYVRRRAKFKHHRAVIVDLLRNKRRAVVFDNQMLQMTKAGSYGGRSECLHYERRIGASEP